MGFVAFLPILATAVAVQVAGGEEHLELQECSSTAVTQLRPMVHPPVPETSVTLVRELMDPFSLQDFAETFWERKPMVIRGRSPNHYDRLVGFGLGDVESVIEKGVSLSGEGEEPMVLGSDWNIIKRVFVQADGEFWTAGLPPSALAADKQERRSSSSSSSSSSPASGATDGSGSNALPAPGKTDARGADRVVSLEEARKAFHRGGFSVVINRLQRRWRGVLRASRALEDVLGQPVNANLYMTPPQSQGFEAHFDWMDGIVVQLTGSKTWILYDEMVTMPRPDLKFKPKAAELGEPIAVLDLHPGDMMYIPRGWPHEAAVNGTAARPGGGRGAPSSSSAASGPSLHVTFGVETALSGTYESLLHHALEVAAVEHPLLFGLSQRGGESKRSANDSDEDNQGRMGGDAEVAWLQLLHLWVHDVASRDARLRKAVPLAPLFSASSEGRPAPPTAAKDISDAGSIDDDDNNVAGGRREGVCTASSQRRGHQTAAAPPAVLQEFKISLEACAGSAAADDAPGVGGAASSTLALLDSLLENEQLYRVREMFFVGGGELRGRGGGESSGGYAPAAAQRGGEDEDAADAVLSSRMSEETEWSRATLETLDRTRFSSSLLREKMEGFRKVASPEGALRRMVVASSRRARERDEITERDLARCGQGPPNRGGVAV